ncbi:uncharacterized protein EV420DRAFT_1487407 [Desarmillaria tabescens]|uniref:Uncharacterized protein n=1 Tax=Armillaria tabescens TaxID=1929756 RepID=A0AA39J628_ARMTA|nr:uncharacterized protein EV420DRAFT_1487407 [Desarmillaria tabescens]KAK0436791.1 hypothetical protein EV420DRAFT_1487407 [Desarmillaria tabescens]
MLAHTIHLIGVTKAVGDHIKTLDLQMRDAVALIPDHVDGQWVCNALNQAYPADNGFLDDFQTVGFTVKALVNDSDQFDQNSSLLFRLRQRGAWTNLSAITALRHAFDKWYDTFASIEGASNAFASNVDISHAKDHVMSDAYGNSDMCHLLKGLERDRYPFNMKFMASVPVTYKECMENRFETTKKMLQTVVEAFCENEKAPETISIQKGFSLTQFRITYISFLSPFIFNISRCAPRGEGAECHLREVFPDDGMVDNACTLDSLSVLARHQV